MMPSFSTFGIAKETAYKPEDKHKATRPFSPPHFHLQLCRPFYLLARPSIHSLYDAFSPKDTLLLTAAYKGRKTESLQDVGNDSLIPSPLEGLIVIFVYLFCCWLNHFPTYGAYACKCSYSAMIFMILPTKYHVFSFLGRYINVSPCLFHYPAL